MTAGYASCQLSSAWTCSFAPCLASAHWQPAKPPPHQAQRSLRPLSKSPLKDGLQLSAAPLLQDDLASSVKHLSLQSYQPREDSFARLVSPITQQYAFMGEAPEEPRRAHALRKPESRTADRHILQKHAATHHATHPNGSQHL